MFSGGIHAFWMRVELQFYARVCYSVIASVCFLIADYLRNKIYIYLGSTSGRNGPLSGVFFALIFGGFVAAEYKGYVPSNINIT